MQATRYISTYLYSYIHTYIPTYLHTYLPTPLSSAAEKKLTAVGVCAQGRRRDYSLLQAGLEDGHQEQAGSVDGELWVLVHVRGLRGA